MWSVDHFPLLMPLTARVALMAVRSVIVAVTVPVVVKPAFSE